MIVVLVVFLMVMKWMVKIFKGLNMDIQATLRWLIVVMAILATFVKVTFANQRLGGRGAAAEEGMQLGRRPSLGDLGQANEGWTQRRRDGKVGEKCCRD